MRYIKNKNRGFTLIETVIATLILSVSVGALLTLAAGGFFSVRYARNQIVADNLLQETLEYVRKSRDDAFLQGITWATWLSTFNVDENGDLVDPSSPRGCFSGEGCFVDPYTSDPKIKECPGGVCPSVVFFPLSSGGFYGYGDGGGYPFSGAAQPITTTYVRRVTVSQPTSDQELVVTATISWRNGATQKSTTQSTLLTNWFTP